ncbi:MAG TPA: class I SAM-dependent DNA methyltransferase [Bacilli bacterium]|nr:class I SAM-dependent DNA methyltransferase [Bacilli bacterium]
MDKKKINTNANLIWSTADSLDGTYKPHEYGLVILPLVVIKRFDCILLPTHQAVLDKLATTTLKGEILDGILKKAAGHNFYNTSRFTFDTLLDDADHIRENLIDYLDGFSEDVKDIIKNYKFTEQIDRMTDPDHNILFGVLNRFKAINLGLYDKKTNPNGVDNIDMGYIFEEIIRRFSESYNEDAGQHYTPREVIRLMVDLLLSEDNQLLSGDSKIKTIYDPACGTGGMLSVAQEYLEDLNSQAVLKSYGQELNDETYAIAKSDILIKGQESTNIRKGNTLSDDKFQGAHFDYIISNPPFGRDWKDFRKVIEDEMKLGFAGRFPHGKPDVSDSQTLFLQHSLSKMKEPADGGSKIAIIHNGSPLFSGDVGNGVNNVRKYLFENDLLEAIIQLPNDIFYNTGITVYIWVITNHKPALKKGKVQLIDASSHYEKLRKNIGKKRVEISQEQIKEIVHLYSEFSPSEYSKIFDNEDFGYTKITIQQPLLDEHGKPVFKKGKMVPDTSKSDTENVPLKMDIASYFKSEVLPYVHKDAWFDYKEGDDVGYEIPFTRHFYKFIPPRDSNEIFKEIKELEAQEALLMKELFGND